MVSQVHYTIFKIIYCVVWPHPIEHQAAYKKEKNSLSDVAYILRSKGIRKNQSWNSFGTRPPRVELSAAVNTQHELS